MKIYTEITMKWDNSKGKLVEVSSESYEYNGDIALLGGFSESRQRAKLAGPKGQPGLAAALIGGAHPSQIADRTEFLGVSDQPSGADISVGSGMADDPVGLGSKHAGWGKHKLHGKWGRILGDTDLRQKKFQSESADPYSDKFTSQWYDPYLEAAFKKPFEAVMKEKFQPLSDLGIDFRGMEGLEDVDTAVGGEYSGDPIILRGQESDAEGLGTDYSAAQEQYDIQKGQLASEEDAIKLLRGEKFGDIDRQRLELVRKDLPQMQSQQANIAKTGMAYSAPALQRNIEEFQGRSKSLGDLTRQKRTAQDIYETGIKDIAEGRRGIETDLKTAQTDFASGIGDLVSTAESDLRGMTDIMSGMVEGHEQWGTDLEDSAYRKATGSEKKLNVPGGGKYKSVSGWGKADITGKGPDYGYETPGGYFREHQTADLPMYSELSQYVNAASSLANWMQGAKASDIFGTGGDGDV